MSAAQKDLQTLPVRPCNKLAGLDLPVASAKYGSSWYPVLPAKLLAFYWALVEFIFRLEK